MDHRKRSLPKMRLQKRLPCIFRRRKMPSPKTASRLHGQVLMNRILLLTSLPGMKTANCNHGIRDKPGSLCERSTTTGYLISNRTPHIPSPSVWKMRGHFNPIQRHCRSERKGLLHPDRLLFNKSNGRSKMTYRAYESSGRIDRYLKWNTVFIGNGFRIIKALALHFLPPSPPIVGAISTPMIWRWDKPTDIP